MSDHATPGSPLQDMPIFDAEIMRRVNERLVHSIPKTLGNPFIDTNVPIGHDHRDTLLPMHTWGEGRTNGDRILMATNTALYEVYITDRRYTDDHANGVLVEHVRCGNPDDAKLAAILRNGFGEKDMKYLDFGVHSRASYVQPIDDDACCVDGYVESESEDSE